MSSDAQPSGFGLDAREVQAPGGYLAVTGLLGAS